MPQRNRTDYATTSDLPPKKKQKIGNAPLRQWPSPPRVRMTTAAEASNQPPVRGANLQQNQPLPIIPPLIGWFIRVRLNSGRIFLTFLACASWAFSWFSISLHRGDDCSLCKYFYDEISRFLKYFVLAVAVCVFLWAFTQWQPKEVHERRVPIWVKCAFVHPFFTVALLFLGDHSNDVYSACIGASWCVFAVAICLLTGVVDDFSLMETCAGIMIQAIFIIHHKKFKAYLIIFPFTSVILVIKQALARYYIQPQPVLPVADQQTVDVLVQP